MFLVQLFSLGQGPGVGYGELWCSSWLGLYEVLEVTLLDLLGLVLHLQG